MEEKKEVKVSLGTVICIFIILVLIVALVVMYLYYNDKLSFNNENIANNININSNEVIETEVKKVNKFYEDKEIVYSSYEKYSSEYSYSVPAININSTEVNRINKEIEEYYMPLINEILQNEKEGVAIDTTSIKYNSYINDNILSLVISLLTPYDSTFYKVYNVDIYTGETVSNSELISLKNITETDFLNKLKISYKEKFISKYGSKDEYIKNIRKNSGIKWTEEQIQEQVKLYEELLEGTISEENCSIKNPIFLNENGEISAVAWIYSMVGADAYYHIVDINLKEENTDSLQTEEKQIEEIAKKFVKAVNEKDWETVEKYSSAQIVNELKKYNVSNMSIDFSTLDRSPNNPNVYYYYDSYDIDYNGLNVHDLSLGRLFCVKKIDEAFVVSSFSSTGL